MKKFIYIASIAALGLASCTNEFEPNSTQSGVQGISTAYVGALKIGGETSTRTSLNGLNYYWSNGDAIGLYAADKNKGGNVVNAPFVYSKANSDGAAEFAGQLYLKQGQEYYAYYPYSATQEIDGSELTMLINPKQSFNAMACEPIATADYNWDISNGMYGSFANNTAPAVSVSTATSKTEVAYDNMQALASYIIMPVTGYTSTPIQTATLTINDGEDDVEIAGTFSINLSQLPENEEDIEYTVTPLTDDSKKGTEIALSMGAGLDLVPGQITNLWFVVPAGISVKTVTVVFDEDDTHPITRDFKNVNQTIANQPVFVPKASKTPHQYIQGDGAIISTEAQFLEYANLVTNGWNAIAAYNNLNITAENSPYAQYAEYAQLPQYINITAEDVTDIAEMNESTTYTVKEAIIVDNLNFAGLTATLKEDLGGLGTGVFASPEAKYFVDVYGGYLDAVNPGIAPIGGQAAYVIQGNNYAIQNLTVVGNGMFNNNTQSYTASINNLTINNLTVNAKQETGTTNYYLIADTYPTNQAIYPVFSGVIVSGNSTILPPVDASNVNTAIFNTVWANNYNPASPAVVNQSVNTIPAYANKLRLNQNFNFTNEGCGIDNFNTIEVYKHSATNPVCEVSGKSDAIKLMDKVTKPVAKGYSVVDATTSYWTGTVSDAGTGSYAEDLAWVVQNDANQTFKFGEYDLNLMGTYTNTKEVEVHQYWWAYSAKNLVKTVIGSETNNTITNVYINGCVDNEGTPAVNNNNLTLIGRGSIVNDVVIDGITIENTGENAIENANIAAVSYLASYGTNIVEVSNMTVNADKATNSAVGGLYVDLSVSNNGKENMFDRINEATFTWATDGEPSLTWGSIAAQASFIVSGGSTADEIGTVIDSSETATTKLDAPKPYFGSATVTISSSSATPAQTVYVDLSALGIEQPTKGSNVLGTVTILPGTGLSDGATVNVLANASTYYQFTYYASTGSTGKLSYVGNLGAN